MGFRLPVLKGEMGETEYFLSVMTFGELVRLVQYKEEFPEWRQAEPPPELLQQRRLNMARVRNEIVPYLTQIPDHFFSAITVEIIRPGETGQGIKFEKDAACSQSVGVETGLLVLDGTEYLTPLDGQHRLVAIKEAVEENPLLLKESIAVIFLSHRTIRRSQQLFSDLNRHAKPTTKTINILFEHRGFFEKVSKAVASGSKYLRNRVNMETNTLAKKSPHIITLGVLFECVTNALKQEEAFQPERQNEASLGRAADEAIAILDDVIVPSLPELEEVFSGEIRPYDHRRKYICTHSAGWQAMFACVGGARKSFPYEWREIIRKGFQDVDWQNTNPEWEGTAIQAGLVLNRRQNIVRLTAQLKLMLGIPCEQPEEDELRRALAEMGRPMPEILPSLVETPR